MSSKDDKMLKRVLGLFGTLAIAILPLPAHAQSSAQPVLPGFLSTSGCPSVNLTPCYLPYSNTNPLPVTSSGGGTTTANQGTPNTTANAWPIKNTDGTNTAAVKAASTPAATTDPALVVAISPNNTIPVSAASLPLPTGAATAANQSAGTAASPSTVVETVQGTAANGAADTGNPVKIGGPYLTTPPAPSNGQRVDFQAGPSGESISNSRGVNTAIGDGIANSSPLPLCVNTSGNEVACYYPVHPALYNGTTWDRQFTCSNQATISVTAASTTQIVALSGTTVIRVCSITVSLSLAGTVSVLTGTGTNCGTPTTVIPAMSLATGTPLTITGPAGGSAFRSTAGGEICVAAVTGNAVGYLTYAQY